MSGQVLIVDTSLAGRITLRARIEAAGYAVTCARGPEATADIQAKTGCDLAILVVRSKLRLAQEVSQLRGQISAPMIALLPSDLEETRLTVLKAGADDVQTQPVNEALLLARIRAVMREQAAMRDLHPEEDTFRALGFAEDALPGLVRPEGRIGLFCDCDDRSLRLGASVRTLTRAQVARNPMVPAPKRVVPPNPDVLLIDAGTNPPGDILRLISELRSSSETRQAMQLVVFPHDAPDSAATALDMGADDVIADRAGFAEIAHRCSQLMKRKLRSDRFRDSLQSGLQAAVTDPLTGLHNRRFAMSQLSAMTRRAAPVAVLLLDLDHFKRVNDTYGHDTGDEVLITLADKLKQNLRPGDLLARMGGGGIPDRPARNAPRRSRASGRTAVPRDRNDTVSGPHGSRADLDHGLDRDCVQRHHVGKPSGADLGGRPGAVSGQG